MTVPTSRQDGGPERVGIVIPTLNEAKFIQRTIESLVAGLEPDGFTLLVVDGGSADGTAELARGLGLPQVDVIANPRRIQSAGVNLGFRQLALACPILCRADAHCEYPSDFVKRCVDTLRRTGADSVVVVLDTIAESTFQQSVAFVANRIYGAAGSPHRAGRTSGWVDHGHHAVFRRDMFLCVGGYDESLIANEDAEFDARQRRTGGKIYLDSDIRVGYYPRSTFRALAWQYFRYGEGRAVNAIRHREIRLRQSLPPATVLALAAILLASLVAPPALFIALPYVVILLVTGIHAAVAHGPRVGVLAPLCAATMHLSYGSGFLFAAIHPTPATQANRPH